MKGGQFGRKGGRKVGRKGGRRVGRKAGRKFGRNSGVLGHDSCKDDCSRDRGMEIENLETLRVVWRQSQPRGTLNYRCLARLARWYGKDLGHSQ